MSDETMILILVGSDLQAERIDRPLGYRLRETMLRWIDEISLSELVGDARQPELCTDVWYLNNTELHRCPAVSIGTPEVNAATAYLANRLPIAFTIDHTLQVQLDPELVDLRACIWGESAPATGRGVDLFIERYLDAFLRSAHDLPPAND